MWVRSTMKILPIFVKMVVFFKCLFGKWHRRTKIYRWVKHIVKQIQYLVNLQLLEGRQLSHIVFNV